jgi:type II secretion system protein H
VTGRARAAFTLIETVVVIAIVGVVAAAVVPMALRAARERSPLDASADALLALLGRAREDAVHRGRAVTLVVATDGARAWLREGGGDSAVRIGLAPGVRLAAPEPRVVLRFEPDGRATSAAFLLRDGRDGREAIVRVHPWTGRAVRDGGGR